jgi:hypothetical protein
MLIVNFSSAYRIKSCVQALETGRELELESSRYLSQTGLIRLIFKNSYAASDQFYKFNHVTEVAVGSGGALHLLKVTPGKEFETVCRLRNYYKVELADPLSVDSLTSNAPISGFAWPHVNKNFCNTGQINPGFCKQHIGVK